MPPKQHRERGRGGPVGAGPATIRRSRRDAPTLKRHRGVSSGEEDYESVAEVDPDVIAESLLAYLVKHDGLMETFIENLFKMPKMQDRIVAQVLKLLKTTSAENVVNQTVNGESHDLDSTIEKLSDNVEKLTVELPEISAMSLSSTQGAIIL